MTIKRTNNKKDVSLNVTRGDLIGIHLAWRVVELADELTCAIDHEAEDIGGCRSSNVILRELGPAVDAAIEVRKNHT